MRTVTRALPLIVAAALAVSALAFTGSAQRAQRPDATPTAQDPASPRQELAQALDRLDALALALGRSSRDADTLRTVAAMRSELARVRERLERRGDATPPPDRDAPPPSVDGRVPPPDVGQRPPPDDTRPPPPDTQPPPAGAWVNPSELGHLPQLTAAPGYPTAGVATWGQYLSKLPAVLDAALITAQAKGQPVVPCLVEGAHQGKLRWSRFLLAGAPGPDGVNRTRWGARWFDVRGFELSDFVVQDVPDEHGLYWNTLGGFRLSRGLFLAMGSQALQVCGAKPGTARQAETGLSPTAWQAEVDSRAWEWQQVVECAALECGQPTGGRPSYALSFFGDVPNPVRILRCLVQTTSAWHTDTSGKPADCYGAVMAHDRLRFELLESGLLYAAGDRDTLQLWGIGDGDPTTVDVYLRGSQIDGRGVDVRVASPDACQIVVDGCWGTASITVSTAPHDAKPPHPSTVLYKGPISQAWSNLP